jgi:hypothetical protein
MRNTRQGENPVDPPVHDDGTLYPYSMYYDGSKRVAFADTPSDLLAVLIPGYAEMDSEQERVTARIMLATSAQVALQAQINAEIEPEAWEALTETEKNVLTGPRFEQPHGWGEDEMGDVWAPSIPLVLVQTGYAPIVANRPQPISALGDVEDPDNIIWLRPADEWEFLSSLARAGWIGLYEATDL